MTKIAEHMPTYCSACFGQYEDRKYVDFEAYYDGPVLEGSIKVSIDDLVICDKCYQVGANLLGLTNADDLKEENNNLGEVIDRITDELSKKDKIIHDMQYTINQLVETPVTKQMGRPKLMTPDAIEEREKQEAIRTLKEDDVELKGENGNSVEIVKVLED